MTGLAVTRGEDGVVTKEELISKLELVINDDGIAERVRMLRESLNKGGSSYENFLKFVNLLAE
jgi:hypothetical protein